MAAAAAASPPPYGPVPDDVTVCVTSCGRLDLLEKTLAAFGRYHGGGRLTISEDSADPHVVEQLRAAYPQARILAGDARLGLMGSLDRLYAAVETPYIFQLEDDWELTGPVDFTLAKALLDKYPDMSVACVRRFAELKHTHRRSSRAFREGDEVVRVMNPAVHPQWYGYTSNPGLLRRAFWERYRPFAGRRHDELSEAVKRDCGYVGYLIPGVARHIGIGRRTADPFQPRASEKGPLKRLRRRVKGLLKGQG
jgi:hypothetical protein